MDQIRSLNSPMHNENGYFQYFAIDFSPSVSTTGTTTKYKNSPITNTINSIKSWFITQFNQFQWTAFHASQIIDQAVFVNEAIASIQTLYYQQYGNNYPFKIILVAHSLGGVIARTAPLLSNHPYPYPLFLSPNATSTTTPTTTTSTTTDTSTTTGSTATSSSTTCLISDTTATSSSATCLISDMILLSTPITHAPYSIDPSNDVLYNKLNNVWRDSLFYQSKECVIAAKSRQIKFKNYQLAIQNKLNNNNSSSTTDGNNNSDNNREKNSQKVETEFNIENNNNNNRMNNKITVNWKCSVCVPDIRVISITGGMYMQYVYIYFLVFKIYFQFLYFFIY